MNLPFNKWKEYYLKKVELFNCNSSRNAKLILNQATPEIFEINKAANVLTNERINIVIGVDENDSIFAFHQTTDLQAGLNIQERKLVALDGFKIRNQPKF